MTNCISHSTVPLLCKYVTLESNLRQRLFICLFVVCILTYNLSRSLKQKLRIPVAIIIFEGALAFMPDKKKTTSKAFCKRRQSSKQNLSFVDAVSIPHTRRTPLTEKLSARPLKSANELRRFSVRPAGNI